MEWDEFYEPLQFFSLMRELAATDHDAVRYLVENAHSLADYEEVYRELLN